MPARRPARAAAKQRNVQSTYRSALLRDDLFFDGKVQRLQVFLGVHGGFAPQTCGGNRLFVTDVVDVPGDENALHVRRSSVRRDHVSGFIQIQLTAEYRGIGIVPDGDKEGIRRQLVSPVLEQIVQPQRLQDGIAQR